MSNKLLKQLKILFVEDETNLALLLKSAIGDNFHSFTIANCGEQGIEKFLQISPDLVITDIMMPHLNGLEMAKELKSINPNVPIIILSAYSEKEKLLGAIDVGIVKYFIKPFDPDELLEYIIELAPMLGTKVVSLSQGFIFNKTTKTLYKNGKYIILTKRERMFMHLLLKCDSILEYSTIKNKLWDEKNISDERLRTFIKRLRIKTSKELIVNIKAQGFVLG
ncbi:MAG: response regulator transcription factor [Campylobacterota bacterium]|nr:response regulator transcription factor [Campylobacterota bacterium]